VLDLIERVRSRGHAVLLISHNLADVFAVADRVVVLRLGRNAGDFEVNKATQEQVVAAITGASDNVVARRAARRGSQQETSIREATQ
jgi:ABC-type sugar transport system ATPase subunit